MQQDSPKHGTGFYAGVKPIRRVGTTAFMRNLEVPGSQAAALKRLIVNAEMAAHESVEVLPTPLDIQVLVPGRKRHRFSRQPPPVVVPGTYTIKVDGDIWLFVDQGGRSIDPALTLTRQPQR